ncbi:hypothetical protein TRIUR3_26859 [Triticum urartu]|uniref:Late embryogenesis abundant protein LEA-2 subgroup domain-containing protein n=1 Tax=Triticum urartu TaxID=4572 RepID=M7ZTF2_TRIUA|nr:hypothetical protein TRIUR3_26859 [Triticum urartu]
MNKEKHHTYENHLRRCCNGFAACLLALVVVVAFIALVVYLALRPTKPSFYLQDLQLHSINLGDPSLSATAQVTLASRNPNDRVGIFYRRLDVFVTYRDEPVTVPISLPPMYQGHRDVTIWSPVLSGESVPVAGYVAEAMKQDIASGYVSLQVKIDGRVKWKLSEALLRLLHHHRHHAVVLPEESIYYFTIARWIEEQRRRTQSLQETEFVATQSFLEGNQKFSVVENTRSLLGPLGNGAFSCFSEGTMRCTGSTSQRINTSDYWISVNVL